MDVLGEKVVSPIIAGQRDARAIAVAAGKPVLFQKERARNSVEQLFRLFGGEIWVALERLFESRRPVLGQGVAGDHVSRELQVCIAGWPDGDIVRRSRCGRLRRQVAPTKDGQAQTEDGSEVPERAFLTSDEL